MKHKFETRAIHVGCEPDPGTGAIITPIFQTSTYAQESPDKNKGYDYSRTGNPTRMSLEKNIASLEEGNYGLAFSSGMERTCLLCASISASLPKGKRRLSHLCLGTCSFGSGTLLLK